MAMLGWVLRILLLLIVLRLVMRFVAGLVQGLRREPGQGGGRPARGNRRSEAAVALVRDPVCGTYVVPGKALSVTAGQTMHYFCSESCRLTFEREHAAPRPA